MPPYAAALRPCLPLEGKVSSGISRSRMTDEVLPLARETRRHLGMPPYGRWQRKGRFRSPSRAFGGPSRKQAREWHSRQGGLSPYRRCPCLPL